MGKWLIELLKMILTALIVFVLTSFALKEHSERLKQYIDDWQNQECMEKKAPEAKTVEE